VSRSLGVTVDLRPWRRNKVPHIKSRTFAIFQGSTNDAKMRGISKVGLNT